MNKKNKIVYIIFLCVTISVFTIGCKKSSDDGTKDTVDSSNDNGFQNEIDATVTLKPSGESDVSAPYMSREEFPIVDGSTANIPLGEAIYQYLTGASLEETQEDLKFYKTPDSYRRLISGEADILLVYEPSQIILDEIAASNVELLFKPLGRDALVFIANESNSVTSLTKEQIVDIYTGKTTNWSEVGGSDMEILPFQRPEESGSQTLMEKLAVRADIIMKGPRVSRPSDMGDLIDTLASYNNKNNALGYSVYFYAKNMYTKPGLKFLAIDDVMPNNETIQKGEYPYINDFYVVIRKDEPEDSNARRLYEWLTTKEAQEIVAATGYVPIIDIASSNENNNAIYKEAPINIKEEEYIILHDKNSLQISLGDSLLDKNLDVVKTFPGKYIVTNGNLVCKSDDIIVLRSIAEREYEGEDPVYGDEGYLYELYDLSKDTYLTEETFKFIYATDYGYYVCRDNDYDKNESTVYIYNNNGSVVFNTTYTLDGHTDVFPVKNNILYYHDQMITVLDKEGKEISQKEFKYEGYFNDLRNEENHIITEYAVFSSNKYIYLDENGELLDLNHYLVNLDYVPEVPKDWCNELIYCSDGKYYAEGYLYEHYVVLREDGKVIIDQIGYSDQYIVKVSSGFISVYDNYLNHQIYYDLNGNVIADREKNELVWINPGILVYDDKGFTVYTHSGEQYRVNSDRIDKSMYYAFEMDFINEVFVYWEFNENGESVPHTSFKGIVEFEDWGYPKSIENEYYVIWLNKQDYDVVLDKEGNILYTTNKGERINDLILGDELYLSVTHGNYTGIKDLEGNYVYRQYSTELSDD